MLSPKSVIFVELMDSEEGVPLRVLMDKTKLGEENVRAELESLCGDGVPISEETEEKHNTRYFQINRAVGYKRVDLTKRKEDDPKILKYKKVMNGYPEGHKERAKIKEQIERVEA